MKIEDVLKTSRFKDQVHKASLNLLYTSYWLKNHLSAAIKENGFTAEQFNVMRIVKGRHPEAICVKDIAERMIEKSSNVPRILDRLILKKYVERSVSKEDKRETLISITELGMKKLLEVNKIVNKVNETVIGLNEMEAALLNELLEKLRKTD